MYNKIKIFLFLYFLLNSALVFAEPQERDEHIKMRSEFLLNTLDTLEKNNNTAEEEAPIEQMPTTVEYYIVSGDAMDVVVLEEPPRANEDTPKAEAGAPKEKGSLGEYSVAAGDTPVLKL